MPQNIVENKGSASRVRLKVYFICVCAFIRLKTVPPFQAVKRLFNLLGMLLSFVIREKRLLWKLWDRSFLLCNFTSSFEDIIDAVLRKSFPCDPISHDNSEHRVLRSDAELVYESDDDVPFKRTKIDCFIDNLSLNKSPGSDKLIRTV
ncbi:hypothetical protein TNIN_492631 [Trichonephila inaurata madagascariensis]|uniref:Uncharacterized protein n=1 Tax=Trichonephila inaurata madagascariensis TaxID=2747483 RepID=A0A8X6XYC1_9ARAC|nr:hypothetical protein TNIN_492631 [Trichonephila inaurata madagascariensis]